MLSRADVSATATRVAAVKGACWCLVRKQKRALRALDAPRLARDDDVARLHRVAEGAHLCRKTFWCQAAQGLQTQSRASLHASDPTWSPK